MARELDDAILMLRVNELELGLLLLKTTGSAEAVLASDAVMLEHRNDWLVRETIGMLRRTLARLDVSSRSMYAIIEPGSCFAGCCSNWRWPPIAATCWRFRKKKATRRRSHSMNSTSVCCRRSMSRPSGNSIQRQCPIHGRRGGSQGQAARARRSA